MSIVLNLFRSVLFFSLCGFCFQSMSDDGSFSLPVDAIAKYRAETMPLTSPRTADFIITSLKTEKKKVEIFVTASKIKFKATRSIASMYDPAESLKKKETLIAATVQPSFTNSPKSTSETSSDFCSAAKNNKGLNFQTPTSYLSSVLKKAGAVKNSEPLFKDHADQIWDKYLSKNNFEDVSVKHDNGNFKFEDLKDGALIVLEKSCFKEGTVAVYCGGKYYATKFVKTTSLLKKVNSKSSSCQLGKGMRIVVEKTSSPPLKTENLASAY